MPSEKRSARCADPIPPSSTMHADSAACTSTQEGAERQRNEVRSTSAPARKGSQKKRHDGCDRGGSMRDLLTKAMAAAYLCVSKRTVDKLVARGELPVVRYTRQIVRFDSRDLDEYIDSKKTRASCPSPEAWAKEGDSVDGDVSGGGQGVR